MLRTAFFAAFVPFYLFHALLLFSLGHASVVTTMLLLATIALASFYILSFAAARSGMERETRLRLTLLLGSLFLSTAVAELFLRYGLARHASYDERNGSLFYTPLYKTATLRRARQWRTGSPRLHINPRIAVRIERKTEFSDELITNSEGLRDREHSTVKPCGALRIIGVGDSFTEGLGADFDSTWLQQLQGILGGRGCPVTVMNGGVAGSDPFFEYALLRDRLLAYGPDVVVLALNVSDIDDVIVRGGMDRFREDGTVAYRKGPRWEWIYASSYLFRHVVHDMLGYDRLLARTKERPSHTAQVLGEIRVVLRSFSELSRERGFRLLVVFHPLRYEVIEKKLAFADLIRRLEEEPIATLDLLEYYTNIEGISERNIDDYYWPLDTHHTPKGYRAFAEGVAQRLLRLGWLPCRISAPVKARNGRTG